jgi:asparagine synthase (glutamine-hydrolysing)
MRNRASGPAEEFVGEGICLAAARHPWEAQLNGWSGPSVASDDQWVVAADATLYYLDDLRRRLSNAPTEATTGALLLQALHQWGPRFAQFVEGDFAIVAWERATRRLHLARDFAGRRNLVYSQVGDSLVLASSPTAVTTHPAIPVDYDPAFIALSASGAIAHGPRTAFRNIFAVPGGSTLAFDGRRVYQVARWQPPPAGSGWEPLSNDAAEELRALLIDATRERLAPNGPTTVFMSGGWDSTSVFGAGMASLGAAQQRSLVPVSLSLPSDDWGYEDDHIRAVGEHWSVPIDWMQFDSVPLMADSDRRALIRDDPLVQVYESMMRSLSLRSIARGSRVALDGFGGDHLFLSSGGAMLADHLFYGRWSTIWEWWKAGRVARDFVRDLLLPHLSPSVRSWIGSVRGRPLRGYWTRSLPDWIRPTPEIARQLEPEFERRPDEGAAEFELRHIVTGSLVPRAVAWNHALGLEEGVEMRGPLFDRRVIEFATRRPLSERSSGGDGKRILRSAMKGLLPDSVLAARPRKTGTTAGYFRRQFQTNAPREIARWFDGRSSILERMGILDSGKVLAACRYYEQTGDHGIGSQLYLTLEAERWLAVRQPGP